ncbi:hypothetical protein [Ferrovibrio terrae]|uniref:hypothetical protein n=1 Tax=Ferrovibrio terrae TaxID=2594003 RepID=UPI00313849EE
MTDRDGLKTYVEQAAPPRADQQPQQMSLLGVIGGASAADLSAPDDAPRRAGRPAGAKNRKTYENVAYLKGRYGSPLERLQQTATANTTRLADELGISVVEAFELQRRCDIASLPYMEQKLPQVVEVEDNRASLVLYQGPDQASVEDIEILEEFSGEPRQLDAAELDALPKTAENGEKL